MPYKQNKKGKFVKVRPKKKDEVLDVFSVSCEETEMTNVICLDEMLVGDHIEMDMGNYSDVKVFHYIVKKKKMSGKEYDKLPEYDS